MDDDAREPNESDEVDEDTATAEALGYSDPEDAPLTRRGEGDREDRPEEEA